MSLRDANALGRGALRNRHVGYIEESRDLCQQLLEVVPNVLVGIGFQYSPAAETIPLFAKITGITDLLDSAESVAREITSSTSIPDGFMFGARAGLALIAVQPSDVESAKEQYSSLGSHQGQGPQQRAVICCDRLLGFLAQTMGNLDQSVAHYVPLIKDCGGG